MRSTNSGKPKTAKVDKLQVILTASDVILKIPRHRPVAGRKGLMFRIASLPARFNEPGAVDDRTPDKDLAGQVLYVADSGAVYIGQRTEPVKGTDAKAAGIAERIAALRAAGISDEAIAKAIAA